MGVASIREGHGMTMPPPRRRLLILTLARFREILWGESGGLIRFGLFDLNGRKGDAPNK